MYELELELWVFLFGFFADKLPDKHKWPAKTLPKRYVFSKDVLALNGDDDPYTGRSKG